MSVTEGSFWNPIFKSDGGTYSSVYHTLITNGNLWRVVVCSRVAKDFAGADVAVTVRLTDAPDSPQLTTQYYGWSLKQLSYVFVPQDTTMVGAFLSMDPGMAVRLFKAMDQLNLTVAELKTLALDYIKAQPPEIFRVPPPVPERFYHQYSMSNPIPNPYLGSGTVAHPNITLRGMILPSTTYTLATSANMPEE